jgi:hypothetical protein
MSMKDVTWVMNLPYRWAGRWDTTGQLPQYDPPNVSRTMHRFAGDVRNARIWSSTSDHTADPGNKHSPQLIWRNATSNGAPMYRNRVFDAAVGSAASIDY